MTLRANLAVIDPGTRVPELDCFNRISRASALPTTYHLPALFGTGSLARAEAELAGIVILGSGASVNDPLDWLDALSGWLRAAVDRGVPALGLCFGHQLLARILGGRVGPVAGGKRKGLREIALDANPLWGGARAVTLVVTHGEEVQVLPAGCAGVGRSDVVAIEAFAHKTRPVWGFQAHPEATEAFVHNNGVPLPAGGGDPFAEGHGLVDAFLAFVARHDLARHRGPPARPSGTGV